MTVQIKKDRYVIFVGYYNDTDEPTSMDNI